MKSVSKSFKMVALVAATTGMVLSSCGHESIYDPDYANKVLQQNWKEKMMDNNGEIDPNQDWNMAMVGNVTITSNEAGTMYLFNGDPLNKNNNPSCIGKFSVRPGETISAKVDLQKGTQFVYAGLYTAEGALKVRPVDVSEGKVNVAFGTQTRTVNGAPAKAIIKRSECNWTPGEAKNEAPSGAVVFSTISNKWGDTVEGGSYIIDSSIHEINVGKSMDFYFKGDVTITNLSCATTYWNGSANVPYKYNLYVLPDSKLTLSRTAMENCYTIYVAKGGTLDFAGEKINISGNLLNEGVVNAKAFEAYDDVVVINEGAFNVKTSLGLENNNTQFWNRSSLKAGSFSLSGSSEMFNEGNSEVVIAGLTQLDSWQSTWKNDGHWVTENMTLTSGSKNWINACKLEVKDQFYINLDNATAENSVFTIDGGGSVITKDMYYHTGSVVLGAKSVLSVSGTATMRYSEPHQSGFYGSGSDYAVLQMNKVVRGVTTADNNVWYYGKLYVATDDHFAQGSTGGSNHFYELSGGAQMTGYDNAPISIEASECSPGYNFKSLPDPKPEPQTFIFACEDLGTSDDFDFNDVVFSVSHVAGETKAVVTVLAAGGTLDAYIVYDNSELGEVHSMLGAEAGMMTNTSEKGITHTHAGKEISVAGDWTLASNSYKFRVRVVNLEGNSSHSEYVEAPKEGEAPQMIILPSEWEWPTERTNIKDAYPDFIKWTKDATISDWNTKKVESLVVKRK